MTRGDEVYAPAGAHECGATAPTGNSPHCEPAADAVATGVAGLILLVDDEPDLLQTLAYSLQKDGFTTRLAESAAEALKQARTAPVPDLVVLDLMLPDESGYVVCQKLRQDPTCSEVPIIMLTARGEESARVEGFEAGADDYVVKPFSPRELILRVRAVLRRRRGGEASADQEITFGALRVDPGAHQVWIEQREISLTALEFKLLHVLLSRRGRVQSRERLLEDVWEMSPSITTRTVDTHVKRLREKLGPQGGYIETVRGVGYRFVRQSGDAR